LTKKHHDQPAADAVHHSETMPNRIAKIVFTITSRIPQKQASFFQLEFTQHVELQHFS
jgi:hypothetical protein